MVRTLDARFSGQEPNRNPRRISEHARQHRERGGELLAVAGLRLGEELDEIVGRSRSLHLDAVDLGRPWELVSVVAAELVLQ
jgi:hypothetical protein